MSEYVQKKPILTGALTEKRIRSHNEQMQTWIINRAKFDAAMKFAKFNGYDYSEGNSNGERWFVIGVEKEEAPF